MNQTLTIAFFMLGNLIGSGFFLMPALLAPFGLSLIYCWAISFLITLVFSLIFIRLCEIFPKADVLTDYLDDSYSTLRYSVSSLYWLSCVIANVAYLTILSSCVNFNPLLTISIVVFLTTLINQFFLYDTIAKIEIFLTGIKFFILLFFPIFIFILFYNNFLMPGWLDICVPNNFSAIVKTSISCLWCFLGIEIISVYAKGPNKNKHIKNGMIIGIVLSALLYLISSLIIVSYPNLSEYNFYQFALKVFPLSAPLINGLIFFSTLVTFYGWTAGISKMTKYFADSGLFGNIFKNATKSEGSMFGLWISSFLTLILFLAISKFNIYEQFFIIADLCVYITLLIYGLCSYSLLKKGFIKDKILSVLSFMILISIFLFDLKNFFTVALFFGVIFLINKKFKSS